ncbi:MAG: hypothetical protein ABS95_00165 [Verrucomicrobia bacterium SCN 57-15]|nr:MAG: hypothetical protein ABS95_00165 [Verrucomicrobia bacterium SCN 57-15]
MNKNRTGTCVLAYLVAMQVGSRRQFVDSERMLRFATFALLGYIAFAVILLWLAARNARALSCRPRFWTLTNLATFVLLAIATWTAWRTYCLRAEVTAAAVALVAGLVNLHRCNVRKARLHSKSNLPARKSFASEISPRRCDL